MNCDRGSGGSGSGCRRRRRSGWSPRPRREAIERAGFTSVWVGGGNAGPGDFAVLRGLLSGSERLIVAPGIANIWAWEPAALRAEAERLEADFPGRFILGLGVSHAPLVAQLGQTYEQPLRKMERFLDELDHPAHRQRGSELPPIVLAALGPKMLQLSARYAGAHPYFTTPDAHRRGAGGSRPGAAAGTGAGRLARSAGGRGRARVRGQVPHDGELHPDAQKLRVHRGRHRRRRQRPAGEHGHPLGRGGRSAVRAHLDAGADHVVVQPLGATGRSMSPS